MASGGRTCSSGSPRVSGLRAQEATPGELVQGAGLRCLQVPDPLGCLRLPRDPGRELVAAREVPGPPRVAWAQCEGSCSQRASTNSCPQKDADLGTPGATPMTCAAQDLPSPGQEITAPCVYSKSPHHMQGHESGHLSKLSCFIRGCLGWGRCRCVAIEVAGGPRGGGTGGGAGSHSCGEPLSVSWLACSVPQSQTTQDVAGLMRGVPRPPCALKLYIKAQLYENKRFFRLKFFD